MQQDVERAESGDDSVNWSRQAAAAAAAAASVRTPGAGRRSADVEGGDEMDDEFELIEAAIKEAGITNSQRWEESILRR